MDIEPYLCAAGRGEEIALPALGITMRVLVPAAATGGRLVMIEETTAPGQGPPLHVHRRQTEVFHFLKGEYELMVDGRRHAAPPGSSAVVPPGVPHTFRNAGTTPARQVFVLTPAEDGERFFRELARLGSPPDAAALAALAERHGTEFVGPPLGPG